MKQKTIALLGTVLGFSLLLAGCSGSEGKMELADYKGVETTFSLTVTDEALEQAIQGALNAKAGTKEITGRAAQNGDVANIDYEGLKDGVAFEGGTSKGYDLELGSGAFIPGFEEGVVGMSVGETKPIPLTFPEGYQSEELAGQEVVFNVTLNAIKEKVVPELTDELVQEISSCKTVEEYRQFANETILSQQEYYRQNDVWNNVMSSTTITQYPEDRVKKNVDLMTKNVTSQLETQGMTLDDYLAQNQTTRTDFETSMKEQAQQLVAQQMVTKAIAKAENLSITDEEYAAGVEEIQNATGITSVAELEKAYSKEMIELSILQEKVMGFISDAAVEKPAA